MIPREGSAWVGSFAVGHFGKTSLTQVMSCPNPSELCVISSGAAYIVDVTDPSKWSSIRAIPVCEAKAIFERGILIFSDFTKIIAYGASGLKWESPSVSSDGIQISEVTETSLHLVGWNASKQRHVQVVLDLNDGSISSREQKD